MIKKEEWLLNTVNQFPNLLKPIRLGNTIFRNRIFYAPTGLLDLTPECAPTENYISYFERKAKGGAAAVNIGECYIDNIGAPQHRYDVIRMKDHKYNYNGLGTLANAVSRYGAVAVAELQKPGIASSHDGEVLLGPSDGHNPFNKNVECRAMTEEEIYQTIDDYAEAALYAKNRGFGMVMVHGGHGWLIQQFFSPFSNKRTDKWGGSAENRARLAVEVVDAIHRKCGKGYPVEVRISGSEMFEGGYDINDGIELAKQLDGHANLIHVSVGNVFAPGSSQYTHPGIFKEGGCNVKFAAEIKKHVSTPVATIGGLSDPFELEEIIASGKADVVVMARGLICEPDMAIKLRTGREKEVRRCLRCFNCVHEMYKHGHLFCTINPESGKDREAKVLPPVECKKKVLVAGGGIAGMQAAITAAKDGHQVILCEKSGRLGGVIFCEVNVPFKKRVGEYIEHQKYMLEKLGVDVRLNTEVTPELAKEICPDAIVAALGASPARPPIPGINGDNVFTADKVFENPELAKGKTVIVGAGLTGMELAIYLNGLQKDLKIIEMAKYEFDEWAAAHPAKLAECGLSIQYETKVTRVEENGIYCDTPSGEVFIEADTVVIALGMIPHWDEAEALYDCAGEFYQVGDCKAPRNILEANGEAWTAAKQIGRY